MRVGKTTRDLMILSACCLAVTSGCGRSTADRERSETEHPLIQRARVRRAMKDVEGAIKIYQRAIHEYPDLARAHFELGTLYEEPLNDYVQAIYHYQRYLELRPNADRRAMIEEIIWRLRILYAASIPENTNEALQEINRLRRENAELRRTLAEQPIATPAVQLAPAPAPAAARPSSRPAEPTVAAPIPIVSTSTPVPAIAIGRRYTVKPGDTLRHVARRMYNDPEQWRKIANANQIANPNALRLGQELIIPD